MDLSLDPYGYAWDDPVGQVDLLGLLAQCAAGDTNALNATRALLGASQSPSIVPNSERAVESRLKSYLFFGAHFEDEDSLSRFLPLSARIKASLWGGVVRTSNGGEAVGVEWTYLNTGDVSTDDTIIASVQVGIASASNPTDVRFVSLLGGTVASGRSGEFQWGTPGGGFDPVTLGPGEFIAAIRGTFAIESDQDIPLLSFDGGKGSDLIGVQLTCQLPTHGQHASCG